MRIVSLFGHIFDLDQIASSRVRGVHRGGRHLPERGPDSPGLEGCAAVEDPAFLEAIEAYRLGS